MDVLESVLFGTRRQNRRVIMNYPPPCTLDSEYSREISAFLHPDLTFSPLGIRACVSQWLLQ